MSENKIPGPLTFNDGSNRPDHERYTNTKYKSNDRKRWGFVTGWPCPFRQDHSYVIQVLLGDYGTPNQDGHGPDGWREEPEPRATRMVLMKMLEDGQVVNVHSDKKSPK